MMLRRVLGFGAVVLVTAVAVGFYFWRTHGVDALAQAGAVQLDGSLQRLQTDFNANKDKVRFLFIIGPSCGTCLMGLEDLNRELVGKVQGDKRFQTFVVSVPALMATAADVPGAIKLMNGPNVIHYWDGDGRTGFAYTDVLGLFEDAAKTKRIYAWDVWMAYAPGQTWDELSKPPMPKFWRHQLGQGVQGKDLDAPEFATEAMKLAAAAQ